MTTLSALQLYKLLTAISNSFDNYDAFQQQILNVAATPRYQPNTFDIVAQQCIAALASDPAKQRFAPPFLQVLRYAQSDANYDATLIRVVESFSMIHSVEQVLPRGDDKELQRFVQSLLLDDAGAQHEQVMASLNRFLNSLDYNTRFRIESILEEQRESSNEDLQREDDDDLLFQVYEILGDDTVFSQFNEIMEEDTMANVPWQNTLVKLYAYVKNVKPEAWDMLSDVLDQVGAIQDPNRYSSYEEYVQKNFLDDGGQQFLEAEADRAQVEHMMDNLSMHVA